MENVINTLHLCGRVIGTPVVGHEAFGEKFYYLTLGVPRLSGAQDQLPVTLSERLLDGGELHDGDMLCIEGQVRSYNKIIEGAGRLLITAFAQKIAQPDERENPNQIQLTGTLCKAPAYRTTPFGREIADMMLAVNRAYGKSDYIPCITWGRSARFASKLSVGDRISLTGRLQSRAYQKQLPDGTVVEKTAYEVSVGHLELLEGEQPADAPMIAETDFRSGVMKTQ